MRLQGLVEGRFVARLNRFVAEVEIAGRRERAHVPNSGRMHELLRPGARVFLAPRGGTRRTGFDLTLVEQGGRLVSIDARFPPALLTEALNAGPLPGLGPFWALRREVPLGHSRLDLRGDSADGTWYIETKSVTLVRDGVALFPDAPTGRGARHLLELEAAVARGFQGAVVFVIQRDDAELFRPNEETDPAFASVLRRVALAVRVLAYRCRVTTEEVAIARPLPVLLTPSQPAASFGPA